MLVHLLRELARQLDRLYVGAEGAAEDALEEALDLAFDGAQQAQAGEASSAQRAAQHVPSAQGFMG
jgi:hypothetical protein